MTNKNIDNDLKPVIADSRLFAMECKHGFISYDHLFVAMLKRECLATQYLGLFDIKEWEKKITEKHAADSNLGLKDDVPLTIRAEYAIKHSFIISKVVNERLANSVHLLLAIMSFYNEITDVFNKAGVLLEDVVMKQYGMEIKQFPPIVKPIRKKPFSKLEKIFLSKSSRQREANRIFANGSYLYEYKQFEQSITACRIGLSLFPQNVELLGLMAYSYIGLRDYENALNILLELTKNHPSDVNSRLLLSNTYNTIGNYHEAAEILDKLLSDHPEEKAYLNNRGFILLCQQRYDDACPYFEKAIQSDPSFAYPFNNLGFTRYKLGEAKKGKAFIDKSLELDKGNSYAYKNKGIIESESGNNEEAKKYFKLALKYGYSEKYGDEVERLLQELSPAS